MHCIMHSIPVSALDSDGTVPGQPELLPCSLEGAPGEDTSREDVLLVTGSGDETVKVAKNEAIIFFQSSHN